jgi:BASS family bile acid:Na+ symporter
MQALRIMGDVGILVFVVATMASLGLQLTIGQIVGPLGNRFLAAKALFANFVLAPALALAIRALIPLDDGFAIGLILMATAAGAPFLPPLVQIAKGDIATSVGALVLLMGATVLFLPLVLPLLIPGVQVNPRDIARSLVLCMLIPLAIGLIVNRRRPAMAARLLPIVSALGRAGLALGAVVLLALHGRSLLGTFGTGAIFASIALAAGTLLFGRLIAGSDRAARPVLTLATGARNIPAALVVAEQNFADPNVLVMCLLFAFVSVAGLFIAARLLGRGPALASVDAPSER